MTRIDTSQVEQIDYCFNTLMLSETYIVLSLFLVHLNEVGGGDYWSTLGVHVRVHVRVRVHSLVKVYVRPFVFSETICLGVMKSCIQMHQG